MRTSLLTAVCLAATLSGCSLTDPTEAPPGPHRAPESSGQCVDLPLVGGDPGIVLGTDWSGEHHAYDERVVVYACVPAGGSGRVALVAEGAGIRVRPHAVAREQSARGVVPFEVTVPRGASGFLRVRLSGRGTGGETPGPVVRAAEDDWHFAWYED